MKLISLLFILGFCLQTQAQKDDLETVFNNYMEATHADDVSEQLDFFYPAMFEYFPREGMLKGLEKTRENGKIKLSNERLEKVSEIFEEKGNQYALVTYKVDLSLDVAELKEREASEEAINNMLADYKAQHGKENVTFDQSNYVFTIRFTNKLYAILDKEVGNWKFLPKDQTTTMVTELLIPEGIRAKL